MLKKNIGRNEPCHCGSNKKYKKCCLTKDLSQTI
ncbi:MAG: SEC-C metal-binding domain-containing protein [bacterium]|nr:SEC-C metal-binding domain-containing protein [bacterium]